MAGVRLDPMTGVEYDGWHERAVRSYADGHVRAGSWPADGALAKASAEHDALLPDGLATEGNRLLVARDGDRSVGMVWFAEPTDDDPGTAVVLGLEVEPTRRGNGYGEAIMRALEAELRRLGLTGVRLHVFGDNTVARSLYRKLGYVETNVRMAKRLG